MSVGKGGAGSWRQGREAQSIASCSRAICTRAAAEGVDVIELVTD